MWKWIVGVPLVVAALGLFCVREYNIANPGANILIIDKEAANRDWNYRNCLDTAKRAIAQGTPLHAGYCEQHRYD